LQCAIRDIQQLFFVRNTSQANGSSNNSKTVSNPTVICNCQQFLHDLMSSSFDLWWTYQQQHDKSNNNNNSTNKNSIMKSEYIQHYMNDINLVTSQLLQQDIILEKWFLWYKQYSQNLSMNCAHILEHMSHAGDVGKLQRHIMTLCYNPKCVQINQIIASTLSNHDSKGHRPNDITNASTGRSHSHWNIAPTLLLPDSSMTTAVDKIQFFISSINENGQVLVGHQNADKNKSHNDASVGVTKPNDIHHQFINHEACALLWNTIFQKPFRTQVSKIIFGLYSYC
jgi:hypothetical protein